MPVFNYFQKLVLIIVLLWMTNISIATANPSREGSRRRTTTSERRTYRRAGFNEGRQRQRLLPVFESNYDGQQIYGGGNQGFRNDGQNNFQGNSQFSNQPNEDQYVQSNTRPRNERGYSTQPQRPQQHQQNQFFDQAPQFKSNENFRRNPAEHSDGQRPGNVSPHEDNQQIRQHQRPTFQNTEQREYDQKSETFFRPQSQGPSPQQSHRNQPNNRHNQQTRHGNQFEGQFDGKRQSQGDHGDFGGSNQFQGVNRQQSNNQYEKQLEQQISYNREQQQGCCRQQQTEGGNEQNRFQQLSGEHNQQTNEDDRRRPFQSGNGGDDQFRPNEYGNQQDFKSGYVQPNRQQNQQRTRGYGNGQRQDGNRDQTIGLHFQGGYRDLSANGQNAGHIQQQTQRGYEQQNQRQQSHQGHGQQTQDGLAKQNQRPDGQQNQDGYQEQTQGGRYGQSQTGNNAGLQDSRRHQADGQNIGPQQGYKRQQSEKGQIQQSQRGYGQFKQEQNSYGPQSADNLSPSVQSGGDATVPGGNLLNNQSPQNEYYDQQENNGDQTQGEYNQNGQEYRQSERGQNEEGYEQNSNDALKEQTTPRGSNYDTNQEPLENYEQEQGEPRDDNEGRQGVSNGHGSQSLKDERNLGNIYGYNQPKQGNVHSYDNQDEQVKTKTQTNGYDNGQIGPLQDIDEAGEGYSQPDEKVNKYNPDTDTNLNSISYEDNSNYRTRNRDDRSEQKFFKAPEGDYENSLKRPKVSFPQPVYSSDWVPIVRPRTISTSNFRRNRQNKESNYDQRTSLTQEAKGGYEQTKSSTGFSYESNDNYNAEDVAGNADEQDAYRGNNDVTKDTSQKYHQEISYETYVPQVTKNYEPSSVAVNINTETYKPYERQSLNPTHQEAYKADDITAQVANGYVDPVGTQLTNPNTINHQPPTSHEQSQYAVQDAQPVILQDVQQEYHVNNINDKNSQTYDQQTESYQNHHQTSQMYNDVSTTPMPVTQLVSTGLQTDGYGTNAVYGTATTRSALNGFYVTKAPTARPTTQSVITGYDGQPQISEPSNVKVVYTSYKVGDDFGSTRLELPKTVEQTLTVNPNKRYFILYKPIELASK